MEIESLRKQITEAERKIEDFRPNVVAELEDSVELMNHWLGKYNQAKENLNKLEGDLEAAKADYEIIWTLYLCSEKEYEFRREVVEIRKRFKQNCDRDNACIDQLESHLQEALG
jgi:chromosome segregation ATPase